MKGRRLTPTERRIAGAAVVRRGEDLRTVAAQMGACMEDVEEAAALLRAGKGITRKRYVAPKRSKPAPAKVEYQRPVWAWYGSHTFECARCGKRKTTKGSDRDDGWLRCVDIGWVRDRHGLCCPVCDGGAADGGD